MLRNRGSWSSVADPDPGSGAFLTPRSGIRNRFFPDPGSRIPNPYFWEFIDNFWGKKFYNSFKTSGFWPRVRARALRAPVFFSSLLRQTGRCAPPPPVAASLLLIRPPKIYKIYRIWVAGVQGFFLSTLPPRPESIQSARPSVVRIGSPHPLTPKRVLFPPFGS